MSFVERHIESHTCRIVVEDTIRNERILVCPKHNGAVHSSEILRGDDDIYIGRIFRCDAESFS